MTMVVGGQLLKANVCNILSRRSVEMMFVRQCASLQGIQNISPLCWFDADFNDDDYN